MTVQSSVHSSEGTKLKNSDEVLRLSTPSTKSELKRDSTESDLDDPLEEIILPLPMMSINLEPVNLFERLFTSDLMYNSEDSLGNEVFAHMVAKAGSSIRDTGYSSQFTRDQSLACQVR